MRAMYFVAMYCMFLTFAVVVHFRPDLVFPRYRVCEADGSLWREYNNADDAKLCRDGLTEFYDGLRSFAVQKTVAPLEDWAMKKGGTE